MTTSKLALGSAAAITVLSVGTAIWQHDIAANQRQTAVSMQGERDGLRAQVAALQKSVQEANDQGAHWRQRADQLEQERAAATAAKPTPRAVAAQPARTGDPRLDSLDTLYADERYLALNTKRYAASLRAELAPLYRKLGLSREQIERVEALLIQQRTASDDFWIAARAQGFSVHDAALKNAKPSIPDVSDDLREILGAENYEALKSFQRTTSSRQALNGFFGTLAQAGQSPTDKQIDELVSAVSEHTPRVKSGNITIQPPPDWSSISERAKSALTPEQYGLWESFVGERQAQQEVTERQQELQRLQGKAGR